MVLHKQLRLLNYNTPCAVVLDNHGVDHCLYSGKSGEILARLIGLKSDYKNSFIRTVKLINEGDESFSDYSMDGKSFLKIIIKCKEDKVNENQSK